ncbi:hypothetical protein [Paenibacillus dendritiformis]|uniref:hypothetical protein n=1 Tax=Paenibacillus dendritiformis TaxID=130049 RepID=UPI00387E0A95
MGWRLRRSDEIRVLKGTDGKTYYVQPTAFSFFEGYIFYDSEGNEIEEFRPDSSGEINYMYDDNNFVVFDGLRIKASFSSREFYL